jgi:hypothetical protein
MSLIPVFMTPAYEETFDYAATYRWLTNNWRVFYMIGILYPTIAFKIDSLGIQKNNRFDTLYLWWNAMLSGYSAWTVWMLWSGYVTSGGLDQSLIETIRSPAWATATEYTAFIFAMSKIAEFGDTALILARGRPLRFIQWFHHLLTYIYAYQQYVGIPIRHNSAVSMFVLMNSTVHTIMYGWYAISTAGFRTPGWFKHMISGIQTTQMFLGCWGIYVANHGDGWRTNDPVVFYIATIMYSIYVFLFGHMLVTNIMGGGGAKVKRKLV